MPHGHAPASPEVVFAAAIATLSRGFPLTPGQLAALEQALDGEPSREALLAQARQGMRAAEVPPVAFPGEEGLLYFLAALTLFALRTIPNEEEPLRVPEQIASGHRLPFDVVPRMAAKFYPGLGTPDPEATGAHLAAYLQPDEQVAEVAHWVRSTLRPPTPPRRSIAGIPTEAFEHPLDRQAREMASGVAGFDDLTRLIFEQGFEKAFRLLNLSSCVRVGPDQFPDLYRVYQDCVRRSGVRPEPELYLKPGGINAHTSGVERPYIMLDSGAVGSLSRPELEFIIGHELGHIRCRHLLHQFMAGYLPQMVQFIPMVGPLLGIGLGAALGEWRRKAELSCDRMGLLICQDPEAALRVMIKWSGVPGAFYQRIDIDAFLRQYEEFRNLDRDLMSLLYKGLFTLDKSHPWTVERAFELKRWYDEGGYEAAFAQGPPAELAAPDSPLPLAERGAVAEEPVIIQSVPLTREERLRDRLAVLADQLSKLGLDPTLVEGLLAPKPGLDLAIVGEQGRGKSALSGRLARTASAAGVRMLELPGLNDPQFPGEAKAAPAVLRADAVIVVLSALQLLTERERAWIEAVLPTASGRVALAVGFWDAVENPEDQAALRARVGKFLRQIGRPELPVFYLARTDMEAPEVAEFLAETAGAATGTARAVALLAALERVVAGMSTGEGAGSVIAPSEITACLRLEHGLALGEAEAHVRARLSALRVALPGRLSALTIEQIQSRGVAEVTSEVQRLGAEAGSVYMAALERALLKEAPAGLREMASGLAQAGGHFAGRREGPRAAWAPGERQRDPLLMSLTAVGAGLLVLMPGLAMPVLGALSVGTAHEARRHLDGAFAARARGEAVSALNGWLVAVEAGLVEELREAAGVVVRGLEDRVLALATVRPEGDVSAEGVVETIREVVALLGE